MTPTKRGNMTMSILTKLRKQGAPKQESGKPDLEMGFGDEFEMPDEELNGSGSEVRGRSELLKKRKKRSGRDDFAGTMIGNPMSEEDEDYQA